MIYFLKNTINFLLKRLFGYQLTRSKLRYNNKIGEGYNKNDLNLNIGSGGTNYPFFINCHPVIGHLRYNM